MCDKAKLRKQYKEIRAALKDPEKDKLLAENALKEFGERKSAFVYLAFGTEAGTEALIRGLLERGVKVCVPRVEGAVMFSVPLGELEVGAYGILQPKEGEEETCEIAFTPLLAADKEGYRLGYGGGYYDRYFALHPNVLRAGYAYEDQICERLPREETDKPLDLLITERGVRYFHKTTTRPSRV